MVEKLANLRDVPPLFLAGVLINWLAMGLLAFDPQWMMIVVGMLVVGKGAIFVGALRHRPTQRNRSPRMNADQRG